MSRHILMTGATGAIGSTLAAHFRANPDYRVRSFAPEATELADESVVGDIASIDAVESAMQGCDTVIHLAACPDEAPFESELLRPNILGLHNVLDVARRLKVQRVILASSIQTISGIRDRMCRVDDRAPVNHYGQTKLWAESMGEMYARRFGLAVIAARIGWFSRARDEAVVLVQRTRQHNEYLSHDDCCRFFDCTLSSAQPAAGEYICVYAVSRQSESPHYDLEPGESKLGYIPQDRIPQGLPWDLGGT